MTEIAKGATDWQENMGNTKLVKHGVGLAIKCKDRLFRSPQSILENLNQEFGIRCYVANPADSV